MNDHEYKGLFELDGRVAVVTGASQGIGRETALGYATFGADIVAVDINGEALDSLRKEIEALGRKFLPITADLRIAADRDRIVEQTLARFGKIDILANIAGVLLHKQATDIDESEWDFVMDVNLKAVFFFCQAVGKVMLKQQYGRIVNISSTFGIVGFPGRVPYAASKAGVSNLTKTLALEWSGAGINVNAIAPGPIATPGRVDFFAKPEVHANLMSKLAIQRIGLASDIVGPAIFLSSKAASFVTGATLLVDGGWCAQ
jgi:2-deoxy-D-gluconate 3-dehydrogenase